MRTINCCYCWSLRTGALILGWLGTISAVLSLCSITFFAFFADPQDEIYHEASYQLLELQGSLLYIALAYMGALVGLIVHLALVIGALKVKLLANKFKVIYLNEISEPLQIPPALASDDHFRNHFNTFLEHI